MAVTKAEAAKMKVAELKAALTEVGLPTNGRKADLLARLNAVGDLNIVRTLAQTTVAY